MNQHNAAPTGAGSAASRSVSPVAFDMYGLLNIQSALGNLSMQRMLRSSLPLNDLMSGPTLSPVEDQKRDTPVLRERHVVPPGERDRIVPQEENITPPQERSQIELQGKSTTPQPGEKNVAPLEEKENAEPGRQSMALPEGKNAARRGRQDIIEATPTSIIKHGGDVVAVGEGGPGQEQLSGGGVAVP